MANSAFRRSLNVIASHRIARTRARCAKQSSEAHAGWSASSQGLLAMTVEMFWRNASVIRRAAGSMECRPAALVGYRRPKEHPGMTNVGVIRQVPKLAELVDSTALSGLRSTRLVKKQEIRENRDARENGCGLGR